MRANKTDLLRIAEAIADRTPIDWEKESAAHEELRGELRCLRVVESIGEVHLSATTTDDLPTRTLHPERWGPLTILAKIGEGAFGEVYRAHDPNLERNVALKLLRPDALSDRPGEKRFLNEARRLARVRHENVVVVHGADVHDGRVGLWTELLEGKTLEESLNEQGRMSAEEASVIGIDLCQALAAVHGAGLVHRDVKTANVMREQGGRIVLLDFSAVVDRSASGGSRQDEPVSGTPAFMAPELFRGAEGGPGSDIYSLGVVLYRLVSGRYPVIGKTLSELAGKHERGELTPLRDVRADLPQAFVQAVEGALTNDPKTRYSSVGEFERALTTVVGTAPRVGSPTTPSQWRRPALYAATGLIIVAAVAIWALWPRSFEIKADLFRSGQGVEERLSGGVSVKPGDELFLEIEGTSEMHVYVLNEDDQGNAFVLFPLPGLDLENPLPSGRKHRLPGPHNWKVTSAGGRESILVVASREPLSDLEAKIADMPMAGADAREVADAELLPKLRGIGGLTPEPSTPDSTLSDIRGDVTVRSGGTGSVRVWEIQLDNPGG